MASAADFEALVERAMQAGQRAHMRPVIEKELLHYDILFALDQAGLLDQLTFQGGTALRLCYGSQRFSEDLHFVGGSDFTVERMQGLKSCIAEHVAKRHGLEVHVKEPKELAQEPENRQVNVYKWQIGVNTAPRRRDLPRQMIKIEVAAIPAYTRVARSPQRSYDFLPDGYADLIILVESLDEILADKLVSLAACTAYVRHRDIWDLHWLRQQGARPDPEMIRQKIRDYGVTNYAALVASLLARLPGIIRGKEFRDQMSRFIPQDVQDRTLLKDKFLELLKRETAQALQSAADDPGPSK
ncbi:MAG: nucleotidyl transferase AbiEii/AbiGii toxin family protein [Steroidobacteraceae bacterium]